MHFRNTLITPSGSVHKVKWSNIPLICAFLVFWTYTGTAQIKRDPIGVPSPNAASLAQYGNFPVSFYTGLPQINIPLYSVAEGGINVPLSLDYHASGVRPDGHPGWVGLNWNLSAGGSISRAVKDIPDDNGELYLGAGLGYHFSRSLLSSSSWSTTSFIRDSLCKGFVNHTSARAYQFDTEPDEYNFNFLGYSGKFYMSDSGLWKVQCDKKIKVSLIPDPANPSQSSALAVPFTPVASAGGYYYTNSVPYPKTYSGFIITTDDGTKYTFGGDTSSIEYSTNFYSQNNDFWTANTWNLSRIEDPEGRVITFTYDRGPFICQIYISLTHRNKKVTPASSTNYFWFFLTSGLAQASGFLSPSGCSNSTSGIPTTGIWGGKLVSPIYLKEINTSYAKISFKTSATTELRYSENPLFSTFDDYQMNTYGSAQGHYAFVVGSLYNDYLLKKINLSSSTGSLGADPGKFNNLQWEELDTIIVTNKFDNSTVRKFAFNYSKDTTRRLTLNSVQELRADTEVVAPPPYRFYYDSSRVLPAYLVTTSFTDHWGFWNGRNASSSLNVGDSAHYMGFYSYKEPDTAYLKAGTLIRIMYPTGGVTDLTYEANTYSKELDTLRSDPLIDYGNTIKLAGGLRIKKISSYDANYPNSKLEKQYFYFKNYKPSTGLTGPSSGILGGKSVYYWNRYKTVSDPDASLVYTEEVFSTQSLVPMSENSGAHIGYSEVQEKYSDGSIINYKFSNFDNGHMDESFINDLQRTKSPFEPFTSKSFERGRMIVKTTYNASGQLVDSLVNNYGSLNVDFVKAVMANNYGACDFTSERILEGTSYKNYTYPMVLLSEVHARYDVNGGNQIIDTVSYTYNAQNYLPQTITTTNSAKKQIVTTNKYPVDVITGLSSGAQEAKDSLVARNILSPVLDQTVTKSGLVTSRIRNNYSIFDYQRDLPESVEMEIGSNPLEKRQTFFHYDINGNLLEHSLANDMKNAIIWDYHGLHPVAKISNSSIYDVAYTSFEADGTGNWVVSDATRSNDAITGSKSFVVTSSNSISGTVTGSGGDYIISYWSRDGALTVSGGTGLTTVTGLTKNGWTYYEHKITWTGASFTLTSSTVKTIDELRLYPVKAQMTTFTYTPLIGLTSQCSANNLIAYYNYDSLGRLRFIRDMDGNIIKTFEYRYKQ